MTDPISHSEFGHLNDGHNALERRHDELKARMDVHADQMAALSLTSKENGRRIELQGTELRANTKATQRVEKNTEEIVTAFQTAKGAFKALEFMAGVIAKIVYVVTPLGVAGGLLLAWWKGGLHWVAEQLSRH